MTATPHRFLKACRREPVDRVPVWLMRQAGRYQASYRAVRQKVGFLELCRSPELIAQVTAAPIDEFGLDAAILFSDILVALPAMGLDLSFEKGEKGKGDGGPKIGEAAENFLEVSRKVNTGEGTIAKLVNDPELYDDLRRTVGQIRKTFEEGEEQSVLRTFLGVFFGSMI